MRLKGKVKYCPACKVNTTLEKSPFFFLLGFALPLAIIAIALVEAQINWIALGIIIFFLALFARGKRCAVCGLPAREMSKPRIDITTSAE